MDVCGSEKDGDLFKNVFQGKQMAHSDLPSFKYLCAVLNISSRVMLQIIYMASKYSANFFDDFTELLVSISTDLDCLVITGAFIIQIDDYNGHNAKKKKLFGNRKN